jgi:hypothetical protein
MIINGVPLKVKIKEMLFLNGYPFATNVRNYKFEEFKVFFKYQEWLNVISTLVFGMVYS